MGKLRAGGLVAQAAWSPGARRFEQFPPLSPGRLGDPVSWKTGWGPAGPRGGEGKGCMPPSLASKPVWERPTQGRPFSSQTASSHQGHVAEGQGGRCTFSQERSLCLMPVQTHRKPSNARRGILAEMTVAPSSTAFGMSPPGHPVACLCPRFQNK